jgi:hypothetical protein
LFRDAVCHFQARYGGFFAARAVGFLLPTGRDARQAGCGGVEISAFFELMHYPLDCCFFWVQMGFGGVRSRWFLFWTEGLKWAEMATAKSWGVLGKNLGAGGFFLPAVPGRLDLPESGANACLSPDVQAGSVTVQATTTLTHTDRPQQT